MDYVNDSKRASLIVSQEYSKASNVPSNLRTGYFLTNEYLDYINEFDIKDKRVLSICGSGDQAFMCLLNGAEEVDVFDVNPLQYYILELKRAAILALTKEEYLLFFPVVGGNINENYNIKYYNLLKEHLSAAARYFWDNIYEAKGHIYLLNIFSYSIHFESDYTRWYYELKELLNTKRINFYHTDIFHIASYLNNTYGLIILSNVYDHLSLKNDNYTTEEYLEFVKDTFMPLLNDGGNCIFHYQFTHNKDILISKFSECNECKCGKGDNVKYLRK